MPISKKSAVRNAPNQTSPQSTNTSGSHLGLASRTAKRRRRIPPIVEKVLHLRTAYRLGPIRIVWYLARYHAITISEAGVYRILRRNGLSRLPGGTRVRKIHTQRYQKQVPGHQIQVGVKFLKFEGKDGKPVKRYQYTAIDDATRIRAMKIYDRHNQSNAIDTSSTPSSTNSRSASARSNGQRP